MAGFNHGDARDRNSVAILHDDQAVVYMPSEDRLNRTSHRGRRLSRSDHYDPLVLAQVVVTTADPQPIAVSPNTPLQGASGMSASQGLS
jgi:hypothetical protein